MTVTELDGRVKLTAPPCHRRLRELPGGGAITGYRGRIGLEAAGLGFEVIVSVDGAQGCEDDRGVERAVAEVPEVRHAERLFGEPEYLVRVATRDLHTYAALRDERLATLSGSGN
ncbi:MAG: Lrp/AsnC family transcriptional regulator [Solirubrobacterales bacterium]|nr:Lrp/AsnC family transcriptional regulator [Solirubrobacterales bacterium]